jgi:hypothetical protein
MISSCQLSQIPTEIALVKVLLIKLSGADIMITESALNFAQWLVDDSENKRIAQPIAHLIRYRL